MSRLTGLIALAATVFAMFSGGAMPGLCPVRHAGMSLLSPAHSTAAAQPQRPEDCLEGARLEVKAGNLREAYRILSACREMYPNDVNIAAQLADIMIQLGGEEEARELLKTVLEIEPHHKWARQTLAQLHLKKGELADAQEHAAYLTRTFPDWAPGHDLLGRCFSEEKDLASAEIAFKQASALDPQNEMFAFNTGVVLMERGNAAEALQYFDRGLTLNPACGGCLFWKARCLLNTGETSGGIQSFKRLLSDQAWGAKAAYQIGAAMFTAGVADSAVHYLEIAVSRDPSVSSWYDLLGRAYARAGRPDDAVKAYERAGALADHKARFNYEQGRLLLNQGRTEDAAKLFQAAVDEDSSVAEAWLGLAFSQKSTKPLAATQALQKYLELTPGDLDRRLLLVSWLCEFHRRDESLGEARRLSSEPLSGPQWEELGTIFLELEQPQEAVSAFLKRLEAAKPSGRLCHNLGVSYERTGDLDKAIEFYEKELIADPNNCSSRLSLAILYFNLERDADAKRHLETLLTRHANTQEAKQAIQVLEEIRRLEEERR